MLLLTIFLKTVESDQTRISWYSLALLALLIFTYNKEFSINTYDLNYRIRTNSRFTMC